MFHDIVYCRCIVINLNNSKERWKNFIKKNYNKLNNFNRFSAIDGKELLIENFKDYIDFPKIFQKKRLGGNLAGMISHQKCWENVSNDEKNDFTLILEDDAILPDDFENKLKKLMNDLPKDWDVFNLYHNKKIKKKKKITRKIFKPDGNTSAGVNTGLVGYCINKKGAQKYLKLSKPLTFKDWVDRMKKEGVDNFWKKYWNKLNIYIVTDNLISHNFKQKSDRKEKQDKWPN